MITYETENSFYDFDMEQMLYRRRPIFQSTPDSHRTEYDVWHPLKQVSVVDEGEPGSFLHILRDDSTFGIFTSPIRRLVSEG